MSKSMTKKTKKVKKTQTSGRFDGVLTPEELEKAVEEYKAKRAQTTGQADEDTPVEETVVTSNPNEPVEPKQDEGEEGEPTTIEEKVEEVKENADDDGSISGEEAQKLYDIIDTLLAKIAFDEGEEEVVATEPKDELTEDEEEELEAMKSENEDEGEEEEEELTEDEGEEEEDLTEDGDDEECENCDDEDEAVPTFKESEIDPEKMNADSVDALVRERVKICIVGKALNLDGIEEMPVKAAKKAIIKAVRPSIRLDGKSNAYINAAFDMACDATKASATKDTRFQKQQMFNKKTRHDSASSGTSATAARERMIARQHKSK